MRKSARYQQEAELFSQDLTDDGLPKAYAVLPWLRSA